MAVTRITAPAAADRSIVRYKNAVAIQIRGIGTRRSDISDARVGGGFVLVAHGAGPALQA